MKLEFLITGSHGTVAEVFKRVANQKEIIIIDIERDPKRNDWTESWNRINNESPKRKIVIHSAMPPNPRSARTYSGYETTTTALMSSVLANGHDFILLSTLSINDQNKSRYARHKIRLESVVLSKGGSVLRIGIIRSQRSTSSFQRMRSLALKFPEDFLAKKTSAYFITEPDNISEWFDSKLSQNLLECVHLQVCADKTPIGLLEALQIEMGDVKNFNLVSKKIWGLLGEILSKLQTPFLDPFNNLRAGMGWYSND